MLPDVGSTIVSPGFSTPRASASRIIPSAVRSLIEPPGFAPSSLIHTSAISGVATRSSRTTGVRPITASTRWPSTRTMARCRVEYGRRCDRTRADCPRPGQDRLHPRVARRGPSRRGRSLRRASGRRSAANRRSSASGTSSPARGSRRDGRAAVLPEPAADEEVEAFHLHAALVEQHALKPDVGDRMLPARVRASGDVELDRVGESGQPILELLREANAEQLRLRERELAVLAARARRGAALERRAVERHAERAAPLDAARRCARSGC